LSYEAGLEIRGFAPLFGILIYMAVMFPVVPLLSSRP